MFMRSKGKKKFWVRCTEEEYDRIKTESDKEGLSMGDLLLARYFGYEIVKPENEIEIKECPMVVSKGGKEYKYARKYVVKAKPYLKKQFQGTKQSRQGRS